MSLRIILSFIALSLSFFLCAQPTPQSSISFPKPFLQHVEGWPVEWNPIFKKKEYNKLFRDVKKALANHLQRITYILDKKRFKNYENLQYGLISITNLATCNTIQARVG